MSFIGATGYNENQEELDILKDNIDANASYINNLVGIPDPLHTAIFGINLLNPGLFGLVERAEVNIKALQTGLETEGTTISGIETTISGIETTISGIETEISGIQTEITGVQTEITGIQGEITGIEGSISAIQFVELPLLTSAIGATDVIAVDARNKANRALDIWDYSGDNVYHKKSGNVGIGTTFGSVLNNKLEVNGNINIPTGSTFRINNEPFNYSHLAGEQPVSSKWTNATDTTTNIYYNSGNVGIGITTAINNKLEVAGNLNISAGSKYKINNVNLAFSDLAGSLSYNSLTNQLSGGTNIQILNGVINNTYELPKATTNAIGGVRPDGTTITINTSTGVISSAAATPQVNSDWTQTNTSLKSFIQNKPTAGTNISLANNTITNIITGSPTQNIIDLNNNYLIVKDKPDSQIVSQVDVPLTSGNEPNISSPVFTETIRTFTHSGGTEAQTSYTITVGQNTICDILIVGGGGGGGLGHGGGGGAGQLVLIHQAILSGTYTIKVGKGGNGSTASGTNAFLGTLTNGTKGSNSEFGNASINVIAEGGGISVDNTLKNGGSGAGGDGHPPDGSGVAGKGLKNTTIDTFSSGIVYSRGNDGGDGGSVGQGGGGGGAGSAGTTGGQSSNSTIGHGGDGLSGITEISYNFKNNFGNYGKLEADGNYWFAGGGAGGVYYTNSSVVSNGGKGGGGSTPASAFDTKINGGSGVNGTGGGGAGGSAWFGNGGNGGSGIVIIKFKTIVNAAIPEGNPITHKTLNFVYVPPPITYDFTNYNTEATWKAYAATIPNFTYFFNYWFDPTYGANDIFAAAAVVGYIQMTLPSGYNNVSVFYGQGTLSAAVNDVRLLINGVEKSRAPLNGTITYSQTYIAGDILRVQESGTTMNSDIVITLTNTNFITNTYTLSVQSGTSIQVNNQTAQYLSGNYTISVGATQSSVVKSGIGQVGSDPYPLQNGSTIAIRYSMLQRITSTINIKKDGLIKYVPASGTNPTTGSWNIIDLDTQPLTQFAGNLPANRLDNIDMSKVATGNLDWSRIASQPALSALSGNLPLNRTDGNLPANRLDNIDMGKVATGNLHHSRVQDLYLGINNRFWRIEYAYENVITFGGIYINKFRIATNLHLNSYNEVYNYFQYFLSMSPNNLADRHMYWFGVVKMSNKVGSDPSPLTRSTGILSSDSSLWEIKETNSSQGVWWLNVWVYTTTFCESIICILH